MSKPEIETHSTPRTRRKKQRSVVISAASAISAVQFLFVAIGTAIAKPIMEGQQLTIHRRLRAMSVVIDTGSEVCERKDIMTTLLPWRRTTPFATPMRTEMEDLFNRFFGAPNGETAPNMWAPNVDVEETDKELLVKADLPGVDAKDVDISIADGTLILKGEKKEAKEEKTKNYHRVERFVGQFYRSIPLPTGCDVANINAQMAKGVITVSIPKRPEAQIKKVTVKSVD
jgi:HSP20 family protein